MTAHGRMPAGRGPARQVLVVTVQDRPFGIPVGPIREVLGAQRATRVPLAPLAVGGIFNLRGRIVTAIDLSWRLGLSGNRNARCGMIVVVEHAGDPYGLMVDSVADVRAVPAGSVEPNPGGLDPAWAAVSHGVCRAHERLLVLLDVEAVVGGAHAEAA